MKRSKGLWTLSIGLVGLTMFSTGAAHAQAEIVSYGAEHVFSIGDVQGGFDGALVADDPTIVCGAPILGSPTCPPDASQPMVDNDGDLIYPIDSEFGFFVVDFLGAQAKNSDLDYGEGWVGDFVDSRGVPGLKISNAATDFYKVKPPLGTWCAGLGGTSVKCSTEHYTVLEHVLSCHETVPYFYADAKTGVQDVRSFPDGTGEFDCADAGLDDDLFIIEGGVKTTELLTSVTPGVQIDANDNTTVLDDIAVSADYSVTLKDDGKPLYRWGGLIKRPNDVRIYARIPLPTVWKNNPETDFVVSKARLVVEHWITNNPNDQLRPEDMENEAATGRKPSYTVENAGTSDEVWKSTKSCYEGDGDFIDIEGAGDPTPIGAETFFKNSIRAADADPPQDLSSDLIGGLTNAWYTSIDRDPFEWSYLDPSAPADRFDFLGSTVSNDALGTLVSGPRWRLRANKYGQDIPGLEIIKDPEPGSDVDCLPPPPAKEDIKYEVGELTTTEINLLDFAGPSPLRTSAGWIDPAGNGFNILADPEVPGLSVNGLPLTEDLDLAIYIKGDRKPTAIFSAQLLIEYECPVGEVCTECNSDYNDDGATDLMDFAIFNSAFGSVVGDPDYLEAVDHDGDGAVTTFDFATFLECFN